VASADEKDKSSRKKGETIKERAERSAKKVSKPIESKAVKSPKAKKRLFLRSKSHDNKKSEKVKKGKKERRFHIIPRFFPESFRELKEVTWPNGRETIRLTIAVIMFSVVFGAIVGLIDLGFDKIFKKVFLHG
jgi:preprotein translocase SecE subunit